MLRTRPTLGLILLPLGLALAWLVIFWPVLGTDWNWDDYHLIRPYTSADLLQVFRGNWDVDEVETPGLRPFTTLFNHLRAVTFGESTLAHRLFLLALAVVLSWLITWIGLQLGLRPIHLAVVVILLMASKRTAENIVWISDGVHLLQWTLTAASLACALRWLDDRRRMEEEGQAFESLVLRPLSFVGGRSFAWAAAAFLFAWLALWTREDSLVLLLLIPLLMAAYVAHTAPEGQALPALRGLVKQRALLVFVALLWALGLVTLVYRRLVVPDAALSRSPQQLLDGLGYTIRWTFLYVGATVQPMLDPARSDGMQTGSLALRALTLSWIGLMVALGAAFVWRARSLARWQAVVALLCLFVTCLPALATTRGNLLLLPTLCLCFVLAIVLVEVWETAGNWLRWLVVVVLVVAVVGSLYRASVQFIDLDPMSVNSIGRAVDTLYAGPGGVNAGIPTARRAALETRLCDLGICRPDQVAAVGVRLRRNALNAGRFAPSGQRPFIPPVDMLWP